MVFNPRPKIKARQKRRNELTVWLNAAACMIDSSSSYRTWSQVWCTMTWPFSMMMMVMMIDIPVAPPPGTMCRSTHVKKAS